MLEKHLFSGIEICDSNECMGGIVKMMATILHLLNRLLIVGTKGGIVKMMARNITS